VRLAFPEVTPWTREALGQAVQRRVPALGLRPPRAREAWTSDDKRAAGLVAAALALAYYDLGALGLLDELRGS
jgi:hypothetical protein